MVEVWPHSPCKIWKSCPAIPMKNKLSSMDTPLGAAHAVATLLVEWHLTGCVSSDIDNPVGQIVFGDGANLVRA